MSSYGSTLATVVALVVGVAAVAGFVAAYGLLLASDRRRRVLVRACIDVEALDAELRGREDSVRDQLLALRLEGSARTGPLDALESLPAELLAWARLHAPVDVRRRLVVADRLLDLDRDVRARIARRERPLGG